MDMDIFSSCLVLTYLLRHVQLRASLFVFVLCCIVLSVVERTNGWVFYFIFFMTLSSAFDGMGWDDDGDGIGAGLDLA